MNRDYYQILGVAKNSSKEEIKKAYRKLAHQYHPDKKSGDESKFKEINEAYYVLGDERRRAEYDRFGRVGGGGGGFRGGGDFGFEDIWRDFGGRHGEFSDSEGESDFADILENLFGFGFSSGRARSQRGRDISIDLVIPFSDAVFGTVRKVLITKNSSCRSCRGSGAAADSKKETCPVCSGSGTVREARRSLFGSFTSLSECVKCRGTGEIIKNPCPACRGEGILKKEEEIEINIPAGINDGEMIRMTGAGEAKPAGSSGDLYIKIHVESHARFWREGNNIITELEIPMTESALGGEKTIEALDGRIKINVPQGVESGDILRIKSRGVSKRYGGRGDLLIKTKVKMPKKLSKKAKDLIEELKKEGI